MRGCYSSVSVVGFFFFFFAFFVFFFFQAEDGIRDVAVTGVQTCALPISGEGYFVNTTSGVVTMNLPAGTLGDEIVFIDYAGTFDSNTDRKSTRLNSSHGYISYAVFCLKNKSELQ